MFTSISTTEKEQTNLQSNIERNQLLIFSSCAVCAYSFDTQICRAPEHVARVHITCSDAVITKWKYISQYFKFVQLFPELVQFNS